jgi:hypothetical protein
MAEQIPRPPKLGKAEKISADPRRQRRRDFQETHPYIQGLMDLLTGGATNLDYEPGPTDVLLSPLGAVTGVPPSRLPALKYLGAQMVQDIKRRRALPGRWLPRPIPQQGIDALEFAQRRWPRLFGHLVEIKAIPWRKRLPGGFGVSDHMQDPTLGKFSSMGLDFDEMYKYKVPPAGTIAHELTHTAENLAIPDFERVYWREYNKPGVGYENIHEIRARRMEDRMIDLMRRAGYNVDEIEPPPSRMKFYANYLKKKLFGDK